MVRNFKWFDFNKISCQKIFTCFIIGFSRHSFDVVLNAVTNDWSCLGSICQLKFKISCDLLLFYKVNIVWDFWNLLFVQIKDVSITCWQVFEKIFEVCFFPDDEWKSINSCVKFKLGDEPIHDRHESSSFWIKHAAIRDYSDCSGSESEFIRTFRIFFNFHAHLRDAWSVCKGKNIFVDGFAQRTDVIKVLGKEFLCLFNVINLAGLFAQLTYHFFEFLDTIHIIDVFKRIRMAKSLKLINSKYRLVWLW